MNKKIFLSARWEYPVMFNYEVNPLILEKFLPPGTVIDYFGGKALVSVVGFLFNNTKVLGLSWPGNKNFEEVNLRFYLKRFDGKEWRRGVGFISEIVPRPAVAFIANTLYNEHYSSAKMNHRVSEEQGILNVEYSWQKRKQLRNVMRVTARPQLQAIEKNSEEEFIFEHYYGYTGLNEKTTVEYQVQHPRWEVFPVLDYMLECDTENLYGKEFVPFISNKSPRSVFLARGSDVRVSIPVKIRLCKPG